MLQWWCSAQGIAWSWTWRAYPGVWLLVAGVAALVGLSWRSGGARGGPGVGGWRISAGMLGVLSLWAALDWPIGTLGAGYLASVHMAQYLLIALAAPPLLLLAVPHRAYARILARGGVRRFVRRATAPRPALAVFVGTAIASHVPIVVDGLMPTQLGSFALDMLWLLTGVAFWWPIAAPLPARRGFPPPLQLLYLFPVTLVHSGIAAVLVYSRFPLYAIYELAPPTGWVTALGDQQAAGGLMWLVSMPLMLGVMGIVFLRWMEEEETDEQGHSWISPARARTVPTR